jgi:hypothetical protein
MPVLPCTKDTSAQLGPSERHPGDGHPADWLLVLGPYRSVPTARGRVDRNRVTRVKLEVPYRLTFGLPPPGDLLGLLRRRSIQADPEALRTLRIDLAP